MRILMLTQFYPPLIGGEERFVHDLSRLLVRNGHDISVVTLLQDGLAETETVDGVRIHRVKGLTQRLDWLFSDTSRRAATPFPDPGVAGSLRAIVRDSQPHVVHAHNWLGHSFVPLKKWSGARFVLTLHDYSLTCSTKKLLYQDAVCSGPGWSKCLTCSADHYGPAKGFPTTLFNWASCAVERRLVDRFVPVSHAVAEGNGLVDSGLPWQVIPNFVPDNVGDVPPVDQAYLDQLPAEPFLLFVGAFGHYKGVDVLIDAYQRLTDAPPLVLIGYQTSESPVQTQHMPDGVTVLQNWPHAAVMAAWQRCLIGFAPSVWNEPCATVPMEAMAVGKPVIATRIGGLTDIVADGETGLLVQPGDADDLAQAITRLLDDADLRARMGAAGRERVRRFQASAVIPQYEQLYTQLIGGPHGA